jgi:hypothetical protein
MTVIFGILIVVLYWIATLATTSVDACREAWKSYALALEVELECYEDYVEVPGEGCGTRARRLNQIARHLENAISARWTAFDTLVTLGEREE